MFLLSIIHTGNNRQINNTLSLQYVFYDQPRADIADKYIANQMKIYYQSNELQANVVVLKRPFHHFMPHSVVVI